MPTRSRRTWKPDSRGYYSRQLGWVRSKTGKLQQHKFLLGTDRKEAERRERKLRELWDSCCESCDEARPLWPGYLPDIAKSVAQGTQTIKPKRQVAILEKRQAIGNLAPTTPDHQTPSSLIRDRRRSHSFRLQQKQRDLRSEVIAFFDQHLKRKKDQLEIGIARRAFSLGVRPPRGRPTKHLDTNDPRSL